MQCSEEKDFGLLRQVTASDLEFLEVSAYEVSFSCLKFSSIKKNHTKLTDISKLK